MLTHLKTYEGVPIGRNNFEDFMGYIRGFLGANFGFSTNALVNDGGFFAGDNFTYIEKGGPGNTETGVFFTPADSSYDPGNLFGKGTNTNEYFRFDVLSVAAAEPQVYTWELLPTDTKTASSPFTFSNTSFADKQLPYRPMYAKTTSAYDYGYAGIRFNGIPQNSADYSLVYTPGAGFAQQSLSISKLTLGAEYIDPVLNDRFSEEITYNSTTYSTVDPANGITWTLLTDTTVLNSRVKFPHTNFSIDFGGHILLWRQVGGSHYYAYIPQDTSSGNTVKTGYYKVVDYSSGEIELNISISQLNQLLDPADSWTTDQQKKDGLQFIIVSAEQLEEVATSASTTNYYSRYGDIYDGNDAQVQLLQYLFDGQNNIIQEIPSVLYSSVAGNLLLQDSTQQYSDGVVLALTYKATPDKAKMVTSQFNRYRPDTLQLYYSSGIRKDTLPNPADSTHADIRAMVEQNPTSWYNRDVLDADYYPVNRGIDTSIVYLTTTETGSADFTGIVTFDPNQAFKIVDTIGLKDLNDVMGTDGTTAFSTMVANNNTSLDNTILKYDYASQDFVAVAHVLNEINDVNTSGAINNYVLTYDSGTTSWKPKAVAGTGSIIGYTPLARTGGTAPGDYTLGSGQRLFYSTSMPYSGTYGNNTLTTKQYADEGVANHNSQSNVHNATSAATGGRIIIRDSNGRASVANPSSDSTYELATAHWVMVDRSSVTADAGKLIRRDSNGRAQIASPSAASDIANKAYVDSQTVAAASPGAPPTTLTPGFWQSYTDTGNNTIWSSSFAYDTNGGACHTYASWWNYITIPGTNKGIQVGKVAWSTPNYDGREYSFRVRPRWRMNIYGASVMLENISDLGNSIGYMGSVVDQNNAQSPITYQGQYGDYFYFGMEKGHNSVAWKVVLFGEFT